LDAQSFRTAEFRDSQIWVKAQKHPINFTINFFNQFFHNLEDYNLKNKILNLLSKPYKRYLTLSHTEKKINLKFYGLHRDFHELLEISRPPLLFYIKRKFENSGTTCERVKYEHFFIEYN
jgi:hypothetical protein